MAVEEEEDERVERRVRAGEEGQQLVGGRRLPEARVDQRQREQRVPAADEDGGDDEQHARAAQRRLHQLADAVVVVRRVAARYVNGGAHERRQAVRRVGLHVAVEEDEVVDRADHGHRHDDDPHGVHHVALGGAVEEEAVADGLVVAELAADDGRPQVDDDAADVDHEEAEHDARQAALAVAADVVLAEDVRFAAHHCHDIEARRGDDDDVAAAERGAEVGRAVLEQAGGERQAVAALGDVEQAAVDDEGARHAAQVLARHHADDEEDVDEGAEYSHREQVDGLVDVVIVIACVVDGTLIVSTCTRRQQRRNGSAVCRVCHDVILYI